MNLPFSSIGAGIATSPIVLKAIGQTAQATSQFFGDLLSPTENQKTNGPLELIANSKSAKPNSSNPSLAEVRKTLADWVKNASKRLGLDLKPSDITLEVDRGRVSTDGPEPIRSQLQKYLQDSPELVTQIVSSVEKTSSPLQWLPGTQANSGPSEPFRLTLG